MRVKRDSNGTLMTERVAQAEASKISRREAMARVTGAKKSLTISDHLKKKPRKGKKRRLLITRKKAKVSRERMLMLRSRKRKSQTQG